MAPDAAASRREREFLDVAALVGDLLAGRDDGTGPLVSDAQRLAEAR